jgi:hypothetical protein
VEQISKPDENEAESKAERRVRKEAERAAESSPLDPWERYRALNDLVDHMLDVIEMADRRTRFALLLLGSLNAANLLLVARGDMFGITHVNPTLVRLYVGCYLVLSLYFLMHAVNALKPRSRQMGLANEVVAAPGAVGLRLVDDILKHALDDYYEVWRTAPAGAINREMALQVHLLARTTAEKYAALRKVYGGVMILLGLTAVFLVVLALHLIAPSIV